MPQGSRGTRAFLAVVGRIAHLSRPRRNTIEVRAVAVERVGCRERRVRLLREPARVSWAEADHGETPAHGRPSQPGTNTTAKYGASSSALAASGITTASAMVPRST